MAMCLLWAISRMFFFLSLHQSLQVHRYPLWIATFTGSVVFHIMALPVSSVTSTYTNGDPKIRDATSKMFYRDNSSTASSPLVLDITLSSSSSILQAPGAEIIDTETINSKITERRDLSLSYYMNQFENDDALTSFDLPISFIKATHVSILPSFLLWPTFLISTNLPEEIPISSSKELDPIIVKPLGSPYSSSVLESYLTLSLDSSMTVTSRLDHETMASSFADTESSTVLSYHQTAAVSVTYSNFENLNSYEAEHTTYSLKDSSYFPFQSAVFLTSSFVDDAQVSTTVEPASMIEPSRVTSTEMTGEFSGDLALLDGGSWSLVVASQEPATVANSQDVDQQTAESSPQANNTNNVIIHVIEKEWAVPVVASLASVTFLAVLILLIVCVRNYRKKKRERRSNMSQESEIQQRMHHQNQVGTTDTYHVPGGWNSGHVSPKYDNSPVSLGRRATRHGRQPLSSLPRNESREYFEMFDLEKSRLDKMADNVDSGEEWTTKFVQEKRLYDYGLGNHRLQNGRCAHQSEDAEGILGFSPISTPATSQRGRDTPPVYGAAPRFSKQAATLSFEEVRWSEAQRQMSKVNTIPPVKPKRVYAYDKLQRPDPAHKARLVGYDNKRFSSSEVNSGEVDKGLIMNDVGFTMNSDRYLHVQAKNYIHPNTHIIQDVQRRNLPTVTERPDRILKCVSYDEPKLSVEGRLNEAKVRPTRKISTVSEPPREYLTVPEISILKSRWMYPSVDNLDQIDSFCGGSLVSPRRAFGADSSHETENYAQSKKSEEASDKNSHIARSSNDVVYTDISKSNKNFLEVNSRKLGDVGGSESSERPVENSAHGDTDQESDRSPPLHDGISLFSQNTAKFSPNVPKIIFTNESEEEGDNAPNQEQASQQTVLRRVRKIARVNNPFLIEGEKTVEKKSEKNRRASAPSMPYNLDPSTHIVTSHVMTRSSSSELLRVPDISSSKRNAQTTSSWSREFYNLLNRTPEHDPEQRLMVKKMIDDRYEALFGKKYSGIAVTDEINSLSPRLGKSRQAVKNQGSSLERDGHLSQYERYATDMENETGSSNLAFKSDFRPRFDELWHIRNSYPVPALLESNELKVRKSLTHGTDGCDNLSIESSNMAGGSVEQNQKGCQLQKDKHLPKNKDTCIKDNRQPEAPHSDFETPIRLEGIDKKKCTVKETSESQDGGQGYRLSAEKFDTWENEALSHSRLNSVSETSDTSATDDDLVDFISINSDVNDPGEAGKVVIEDISSLHSPGDSKEHVAAQNPEVKSSNISENSIIPIIDFNEIPCALSQDDSYQIVSNEADMNNQRHVKIVSHIEEDQNSNHISGTTERSSANKHNKHEATAPTKLNENVQIRLELFPLESQKVSPESDVNIIHALTALSPPNPRNRLSADDNLHQEEGADFSDGLRDSIPSSRDISFIDTSEEDNIDMDYFESLLSSSV